jgi:hypothetical protein
MLRKPMLLEPEKAQLFVMTIACLRNFLRINPDSAAIYTPPGSWSAVSKENMTSLFPIRKIARKPLLKAKELKGKLAAYFLSGGRVEWQNGSHKAGTFFRNSLP